jgi:Flp pilus assembly pilin Flp
LIEHIRRPLSGNVDDGGASTVEYGLLTVTIAAMVVGMVFVLGQLSTDGLAETCDAFAAASVGDSATCGPGTGSDDPASEPQ